MIMSKIEIDIRDNISPSVALKYIEQVVADGKVSEGERNKKYYCWVTRFSTSKETIIVATQQYRKNDCFIVYKEK